MAKTGTVIATTIVAGAAVAGGAYGISKLISKCQNITLVLDGPLSADVNTPVSYVATLQQNSTPLANATVALMESSTSTAMSDTTDGSGNVSFSVDFQNAGNYTLNAVYQCGTTLMSSNVINVTVGSGGTSGCQSPTGEVCTNVDGSCPANSFADTYNPGCCIPCNQLIPYEITIDSTAPTDLYYYINGHDYSVHPSCPSCIQNCTTNFSYNPTGVTITGKLIDSAGHGICNQQINLTVANNGENTVFITYPNVEILGVSANVTWYVGLGNGSGITDSEGNFSIVLGFNVAMYAADVPLLAVPSCYSGIPSVGVLNYLITASLPGTTITQIGSAVINLETSLSIPL